MEVLVHQPATGVASGRGYLPSLDGLRGIAILLVMVTHLPAQPAAQLHRAVPQLMHMGGYLGVDLFFVLSGFLITRILLVERENGGSLRFFLIRRCLRIFPLYYLVLLLNAIVLPSQAVLWCAVYLSNYYFALHSDENLLRHTWSLCIEEHFYLLWPLAAHRLPRGVSFRVLVGVMALSLLSSTALVWLNVPHASALIYGGTSSRVWSLALGATVAYGNVGGKPPPTARCAALLLGVGAVLAVGAAILGASGRTPAAYLTMVPAYSLVSLGALLASLDREASLVAAFLRARPLRFLGRISYGLYLFHPFAYRLFMHAHGEQLSWSLMARAVLGAGAAVGVAVLSYDYFESYFLRMKSRFVAPDARRLTPEV